MGQLSREVKHISVVIDHEDGSVTTFRAERPVSPCVEVVTPLSPNPISGDPDALAPLAIAAPELTSVKVEFRAHPRHPLRFERVTEGGVPEVHRVLAAFVKATGWNYWEVIDYIRRADAEHVVSRPHP
jgi:hypothetical protein